jgi:hypothetical protein
MTIININKISYIDCYKSFKFTDDYSNQSIPDYNIRRDDGIYRKSYIKIYFSDNISKSLYFDSDDDMSMFNNRIINKMENVICI